MEKANIIWARRWRWSDTRKSGIGGASGEAGGWGAAWPLSTGAASPAGGCPRAAPPPGREPMRATTAALACRGLPALAPRLVAGAPPAPGLAPGPAARRPPRSPVLGCRPPLVEQAEERAGGGGGPGDGGVAHGEVLAVGGHGANAAAEPSRAERSRGQPSGRGECRDGGGARPAAPPPARPACARLRPGSDGAGGLCNGERGGGGSGN